MEAASEATRRIVGAAFVLTLFFACGEDFTSGVAAASGGAGGESAGGKSGAASGGRGGSAGTARSGSSGSGGSDAGSDRGGSGGAPAGNAGRGGRAGAGGGVSGTPGAGGVTGSSGGVVEAGAAGTPDAGAAGSGEPEPLVPQEGLLLWLKADHGVSVLGEGVSIWADQSKNEANATQTTPASRPRLVNDAIGTRPALEFDGVDDYLNLPQGFADFSQGVSIFAIYAPWSIDACWGVAELSNGAEVDDVSFGQYLGAPLYEVYLSTLNGGGFELGTPVEMAVVHRPDLTGQLRMNGDLVSGGSMDLPVAVAREQNFIGLTLYSGCLPFPGLIGEILIYSRAVTDEELLSIEAYLTSSWSCCGAAATPP